MKRKLLVLLAILAMTCWAGAANADLFFTLTQGNTALSGFDPPYGFVDIHTNGNGTATVVFSTVAIANGATLSTFTGNAQTGAFSPGNTYVLMDGNQLDLNLASTSGVSASGFHAFIGTTEVTGFTFTPQFNLNNSVDGWGKFNLQIDGDNLFKAGIQTVIFTITGWPGLTTDPNLFPVAAHIGPPTGVGTGFATVPIPPTALLLGSGLLGIIALGVRRRKP